MNRLSILFVFVLTLSAGNAVAQTTDNKEYNVWNIQKDSAYFIFAKKAYVRSGAGTSNAATDSLQAGAKIIVTELTDKFETAKGMYAPWVKVSYTQNGQTKEGYVWLGLVAIKNGIAGTANFVLGIDRLEKDKQRSDKDYTLYKYVLQLKAINSDTLADQKEWKVEGGEMASYVTMLLLGDTKLQNLQDVVRVSAGGEACGIPTNYYYYGWTGAKFLPLPGKYSVGDAGVFYHAETLLFPNEKGGQPNKIIKLSEEEEVIQEETETQKEKVKRSNSKEVYVWNGEKAIKQK